MELTQDLGVSDFPSQRQNSEQIAYLGICGQAYPIKNGRNTIGRHPDSDICIDAGSISKLHAVINVSRKDDIKLMDCGSLNRTKLGGKTLTQYQALPLNNGDMVQFGSEMGIFRLCEDEDDELPETQHLPLTQAIPDTPVPTRIHQRVENCVVPESPDIDDEFVFRRPSDVSFIKTPKNCQQKNVSIHDLETQLPAIDLYSVKVNSVTEREQIAEETKQLSSKGDSDDEILFEEVDDEVDIPESQNLFGDEVPETMDTSKINTNSNSMAGEIEIDVNEVLTQKLPPLNKETDTDNQIVNKQTENSKNNSCVNNIESNIEEQPTQILNNIENKNAGIEYSNAINDRINNIYDMPTQDVVPNNFLNNHKNIEDLPTQTITTSNSDVTDMPTQIINHKPIKYESNVLPNDNNIQDIPTQIMCANIQDMPTQIICNVVLNEPCIKKNSLTEDHNIEELPTQMLGYDMINLSATKKSDVAVEIDNDDELTQIINVVPHDNNKICEIADIDIENQMTQIVVTRTEKPEPYTLSTSINKSNNDCEELINQNTEVTVLLKSGSSDLSLDTPKKRLSKGFVEVELPNTQDIKTTVSSKTETHKEELTSESEDDNSKENTPVLFRPKRRIIKDIKLDFTKENLEKLSKVSTRTRKPTPKMQAAMEDLEKKNKNTSRTNLMKANDSFSEEIVIGNISRIQNYINKDKEDNNNMSVQNDTRKSKSKSSTKNESAIKKEKVTPDKNKTNNIIKTYSRADKRKSDSKNKEKILNEVSGDSSLSNEIQDSLKTNNEKTVKQNNKTITETKDKEINQVTKKDTTNKYENRSKKYERSARKIKEEKTSVDKKYIQKECNKEETKTRSRSIKSDEIKAKDSKILIPVKKAKNEINVTNTEKNQEKSKNQAQKRKLNEVKNKTVDNNINKDNSTNEETGPRRSKRIRTTPSEKNVKDIVSILKKPTRNNSNLEEISIEYGTRPIYNNRNKLLRSKENPFKHIGDGFSGGSIQLRTPAARIFNIPHILFSAFPDNDKKRILEKLGAIIATDVRRCTVLATCNFSRTFKILCAIGLGKPIVGNEWFKACVKADTFVDPWQYIVRDKALESRYKFNLKQVLQGPRNFLSGHTVTSTPAVAPTKNEMKLIVESSGGTWGESEEGRWLCLTCERDSKLWPDLRKRGATLAVVELILAGVLKQELDLMKYTIA